MIRKPIPLYQALLLGLIQLIWAHQTLLGQAVECVAVEEMRIGSIDDPDASLSSFRTVAVGPDGGVYIPQVRSGEVRRYDANGQFLGVFGGKGQGPGEFESISTMGWLGDTLWIHDRSQRRNSFFTPDGTFIRSRLFVPEDLQVPFVPGPVQRVAANGDITTRIGAFSHSIAEGDVEAVPVIMADGEGATTDTLAVLPVFRREHAIPIPNGWLFARHQPWGDDPLWSALPNGSGFYRVDRRAPTTDDPSEFHVTHLDSIGRVIFEVAVGYEPYQLNPDLAADYVYEMVEWFMNTDSPTPLFSSRKQAREAIGEKLYVPDFVPPVSDLVAGRDGSAWLQRENTMADSATWEVVDSGGRIAKRVTLPAGATVLAADLGYAWARVLDELDVPYLIRYRLEPQ